MSAKMRKRIGWLAPAVVGVVFLAIGWVVRAAAYWPDLLLNLGTAVLLFTPLYYFQRRILEQQHVTSQAVSGLSERVSQTESAGGRAETRLQELAERVTELTAPHRRADEARRSRQQAGGRILETLKDGLVPVAKAFEDIGMGSGQISPQRTILEGLNLDAPSPDALLEFWEGLVAGSAHTPNRAALTSGAGIQVFNDGTVRLVAAHMLSRRGGPEVIWQDVRLLQLDDEAVGNVARELGENLRGTLEDALVRYAEELEATKQFAPSQTAVGPSPIQRRRGPV
jgi:hypothetical protein